MEVVRELRVKPLRWHDVHIGCMRKPVENGVARYSIYTSRVSYDLRCVESGGRSISSRKNVELYHERRGIVV